MTSRSIIDLAFGTGSGGYVLQRTRGVGRGLEVRLSGRRR
jgi:hypothetical protein